MKSYRINFWDGSKQYTNIVSTTHPEYLRNWYKKNYNRFTMEEIV